MTENNKDLITISETHVLNDCAEKLENLEPNEINLFEKDIVESSNLNNFENDCGRSEQREPVLDMNENSNESMTSDCSSSSINSSTTTSSSSTSSSSSSTSSKASCKTDEVSTILQKVKSLNNSTIDENQIDELEAIKLELSQDENSAEICGLPAETSATQLVEMSPKLCDIETDSITVNDIVALKDILEKDDDEENDIKKDEDIDMENKQQNSTKNVSEAIEKIKNTPLEKDLDSPDSIVSECYGFESGEESEPKEAIDLCQRLLGSPKSTENHETNIPNLSELSENALEMQKDKEEKEIADTTVTSTNEHLFSVEEALAEMYKNVGVLSDMEDENQHENNLESNEVLIINLQEILDSDSDLYVLECDVNEENMLENVDAEIDGTTVVNDTNLREVDLELVHILNDNNYEADNEEEEAEEEGIKKSVEALNGDEGTNSPEFVSTPIPSIHHEEIVPDNYVKYKKENFLKYLHTKYVQNHTTKFYCAHRILKKYKKRLMQNNI